MSSEEKELAPFQEKLRAAKEITEPFKRRLYIIGVITDALARDEIAPVLVGGAAVEFYTLGSYATQDVDVIVAERERFDAVLRSLGFSKNVGERHWYSEELEMAIEVPDSVLAGSTERVVRVQVGDVEVHVIGLEDLVMDRLRAFVYWRSSADGEWAARLMALHEGEIDWGYLRGKAAEEGLGNALDQISATVISRPPDGSRADGLQSPPVSTHIRTLPKSNGSLT